MDLDDNPILDHQGARTTKPQGLEDDTNVPFVGLDDTDPKSDGGDPAQLNAVGESDLCFEEEKEQGKAGNRRKRKLLNGTMSVI